MSTLKNSIRAQMGLLQANPYRLEIYRRTPYDGNYTEQKLFKTEEAARAFAKTLPDAVHVRLYQAENTHTWQQNGHWRRIYFQ